MIAPWLVFQVKQQTVAFGLRNGNTATPGTRQIILRDASLQNLLIFEAEVDETKVFFVGETDAGKGGSGWNTSSEQEHALHAQHVHCRITNIERGVSMILLMNILFSACPTRDIDDVDDCPATLQHRLAYPKHKPASFDRFCSGAIPRAPIQHHLRIVLVFDLEATVDDGFADTLAFFFATHQPQLVDLAEAD